MPTKTHKDLAHMLKIIMISDVYLPRINGVSSSIQTFRQRLKALGCEVVLIAPQYPESHADDDLIWRVPSHYLFVNPEDRIMHYSKILRLYSRLQAWRPQLLHIQTPFVAHYAGVKLAKRLHIPIVESYHTFFEEYLFNYAPVPYVPKSFWRWIARTYSHSQCQQADHLIVPSQPMLDILRGYDISTAASILPTGIDLTQFSGGDGSRFRQRYQIAAQRPTLVHVGRIAHEKNISFLLHMLHRLKAKQPNILLIIAGDGPARATLEKQTKKLLLQDNLLFTGYCKNPQDLMDCYCAGDVFVFSSRTETQGLVLLEAMALGIPVVSTAMMGSKDILQAEQGALIAQENVADFADKVQRILQDPPLRQHLSQQAKDYVKQWQAPLMAQRLVDVYNQLLSTKT